MADTKTLNNFADMNKEPIPMLFPYDPAQYWEQVRQIVREEVSILRSRNEAAANPYQTPGLTEKPLYTMDEVAAMFQISKPTIYDWARHGKLKPVKIRGRVYFLHGDIQELLQKTN
jgi:excisionase family DNA binding protein